MAVMRDFSADHDWLALNTITLRKQGDLGTIVDACARYQIRAIAPWRDEIAMMGATKAARRIRDAGLSISGYCRAGMFVADQARRKELREDNRRAIDEAKELGAPSVVVVVGGLPQYSRPGSRPSKNLAGAREMAIDELAELFAYAKTVGRRLPWSPCIQCMPPSVAASTPSATPSTSVTGWIPSKAACSELRSTSITHGGTRGSAIRSRGQAAPGYWPSTSATGWFRPSTCSTIAE